MIKISLFFINSRSFSRSEHCFVCGEWNWPHISPFFQS
jgi:hypothetical protein